MAIVTEITKRVTPVGKSADVIRAAGERHLPKLGVGSCPMKVVLEAWIIRYGPHRRIRTTDGSGNEEIMDAARSLARCWMANGMREKAEALIKTYGLDAEEVARASSMPPQPRKE
ncbi:MAG: hypothetical protein NTY83_02610 [Candidatus Micrarchaeota archaeon]|nr:hypothetical protein [Candidatus Micrarchaeota archaeon]